MASDGLRDAAEQAAAAIWAGTVAFCGPARGKDHEFACQSCGKESDDIEDFNASTCWECCERMHWSDLCQQERHEECVSGQPGDEGFCPCPHHDHETPAPAGAGPDGAEGNLAPARGASPRSASLGITVRPSPFPPPRGGGRTPEGPVPASAGHGTGEGQRERRKPPAQAGPGAGTPGPRSPGAPHTAPGAKAGASPAPQGDAPATDAPPPPLAPIPQEDSGGEGPGPAGGGNAASPPAGQDFRDAWTAALSGQAKDQRSRRGAPWPRAANAGRRPRPGMTRILPPGKPPGGAA